MELKNNKRKNAKRGKIIHVIPVFGCTFESRDSPNYVKALYFNLIAQHSFKKLWTLEI